MKQKTSLVRPAATLILTALLAAVSLYPRLAAAQDAASKGAAPEEPTAEHPEAANRDEGDEVAVETAPAVTEVTEAVIILPGGVPLEPTESDAAIETVKASLADLNAQAEAGLPDSYTINFGDTFDWVQMVSGEWIKGEVKRMRDDNLEFDSDKLDMQNIDFADVVEVHSPNVNTYVFDDRLSATGRAVITQDKVIVETEEGTRTFDRAELESIVAGGERERDWWSMKLRFGLTLNRGNTDQLTYDILFNVVREDRMTLLDLNYNSSFGRTGGQQNVNRHLGEFDFKVFLSSRWFVAPAFGQLFNDRFQNIQFRATPAAGAGVHIIDKPKVKWDFQTGVGYQFLKYRDASQVEGSNPQNDVFIPLYTYADFDITGDVDFTVSWLTNLVVTTIGNTNHTGKADLSVELTSAIDLDISFLFLRTETPAPPPEPTDPAIEQNDYQLIVGIALELG
ncbi:MAG: DUF481 domain-containing protein [Myxococcota bacterium]